MFLCIVDFMQLLIIYLPLIYLVSNHRMSIPMFTYYFTITGTLSILSKKFSQEFYKLMDSSADVSIGREYLDYVDEIVENNSKSENNTMSSNTHITCIEFKHVYYKYPNDSKYIIKDMNFKIFGNTNVAIVGMNGAGKSTLISLLMGLLKPTKGEILINNVSSDMYSDAEYVNMFSPVFQKGAIFADTIENNVKVDGSLEKDVKESVISADFQEDVNKTINGIQTELTQYINDNGVSLSGGQVQKLMLSRALYKDGKVLVLDEPTAALDSITESNIYKKYSEISSNKISIFISHRLASTQFADVIFFIKNGTLQDEGTHKELLIKNIEYKKLYDIQSKYYKED